MLKLTLEQAWDAIAANIKPLPAENKVLQKALGQTAALAVKSPVEAPPFRASSLDGFALRGGRYSRRNNRAPGLFESESDHYGRAKSTGAK